MRAANNLRAGKQRGAVDVITLVLAESSPILLEGLDRMFRSARGFSVLGCCRNGDDAWLAIRNYHPDVLVVDLRIGGKHALAVLAGIAEEAVPTRVVLLADSLGEHEIFEAARLGAKGIVLKTMTSHLLIQCVRKVHQGGIWLEQVSTDKALDRLFRQDIGYREAVSRLSARELEVVRMIAQAQSNKEIADKLHVCEGTVKSHLHHVYEKLGVRGRLELLLYARDKGLCPVLVSENHHASK